ncbi:MAG: hypothetical protein DI525_07485 [Corynebacterium kroppenstedtii]|uniref:Uncharacterized protein n=1 Tax=Corynebacterium kroppenstedtii TaxID=161879 RepID=A0A2W5SRH0_9CORY|nr:MAG: hypothetical protein DI525_07485 [Corynebacterium kroppenstedtii]
MLAAALAVLFVVLIHFLLQLAIITFIERAHRRVTFLVPSIVELVDQQVLKRPGFYSALLATLC